MKSIRIEFIEDKRWRVVWGFTAVAAAVIIGVSGWQWRKDTQAIKAVEEQIGEVKRQAAQLKAQQERPDPRRESTEAAMKLLQRDLNKAFAVVENLDEPGVRLHSFDLDAVAGTLRLEYSLDSMAHASTVTAVLNGGYERPPWQLESVSGAALQRSGGGQQAFRGLWTGALDKL